MRVKIDKRELEYILDLSNEIVLKKSINPILSNILLETNDGILKLTATDTELTLIADIPADVMGDGSACVSNSTLRELIKASTGALIFEKENSLLKMSSDKERFKVTLNTLPSSEFPVIETEEIVNAPTFTIKGFVFRDMISKNIPFASKEETRYTFMSVFVEKTGLELRTVSSDTRRLALVKSFIDETVSDFSFLIPLKTAKILKSMVKDGDLQIKLLNKRVAFVQDNITLISSQVEGDFPDYKAVIPQETEHNIVFNRTELEKAIKILNPFFTNDNQRINLYIRKDAIKVATDETEMGQGEDFISTDYEGENIDISFNYSYIKDIIASVDEEEIMMKIKSPEKPVIFKGKNNDNCIFVTVPSIRSR